MTNVYILSIEEITDFEKTNKIKVFSSYKKAKKAFDEEVNAPGLYLYDTIEKTDSYLFSYDNGYAIENSICIEIIPKEVN